MRSLGRPELATVVLAVIRGLLMDLDATGDTTGTHRGLRRLPYHDRQRLTTRKDALPGARFQPWSCRAHLVVDGAGAANYDGLASARPSLSALIRI